MKEYNQEELIIERYKQDEQAMILIFAQWCINEGFDPIELYKQAYSEQTKNKSLMEAIEKTVPAKESAEISLETVIQVLQIFGNDDLAFVVSEAYERRKHKQS